MQKKIIALAIAGLSATSAFAADTVTLYGVADAYVGSTTAAGKKSAMFVGDSGLAASRLGFKGVEDLGGGLKALFVLEYRLDLTTNSSIGGIYSGFTGGTSAASASGPARQQMVGLTGNFGTAVVGRLQTTAYDWAVKFDPLAGSAISPLQFMQGAAGGVVFNATGVVGDARANSAIAYISPSFSGVTLAANYAMVNTNLGIADTATDNKLTATLLSASYDNGPIAAGIVYDKHSGVAASFQGTTDWAFGASYNFGVAKVFATYQTTKNDDQTGVAANTDKAYSLGVAAPVSAAGTVVAAYAKQKLNTVADSDANAWTLAYTHGLSKRTTLYAGYARVSNGASALGNGIKVVTSTSANQATSATELAGSNGGNVTALVAGINHKF